MGLLPLRFVGQRFGLAAFFFCLRFHKTKSRCSWAYVSFWKLKGWIYCQAPLGCWQKSVPCGCRTEVPFPCWLLARGILSFSGHPIPWLLVPFLRLHIRQWWVSPLSLPLSLPPLLLHLSSALLFWCICEWQFCLPLMLWRVRLHWAHSDNPE